MDDFLNDYLKSHDFINNNPQKANGPAIYLGFSWKFFTFPECMWVGANSLNRFKK